MTLRTDQKHLIVLTDLGLGNRLMSLSAYSAIASATHRELQFTWPKNELVCEASFGELFSNHKPIDKNDLQTIVASGDFKRLNVDYGIGSQRPEDLIMINSIPQFTERYLVISLSCYFEPNFISHSRYYTQIREFLTSLVPQTAIISAVDRYCESHGIHPDNPRIMGLHIRRTDGQRQADLSTDEQFIEIVERELGCYSGTQFYLATDCCVTEAKMLAAFPGKIIVYPKTYRDGKLRTSSLIEALIELYILSRCHHIYGSYGSSFSKLASVIRGCKFEQVGFA